jgi:hypothetical protein
MFRSIFYDNNVFGNFCVEMEMNKIAQKLEI